MKKLILFLCLALIGLWSCSDQNGHTEEAPRSGVSVSISTEDPSLNLPPHIRRVTWFGQRADWSHDGKKILFVEKTYGDVYEVEVATGIIKPVTHHFYHGGFTRALYLANGDVILSGAWTFDAENPHVNRHEKAELMVMDKSFTKPPVKLDTKCSEGPAVSRKNMRIAWTINHRQYPDKFKDGQGQIWVADIEYHENKPQLINPKLLFDNQDFPDELHPETQNFRPPGEQEIIFSGYGYRGTEVMGIHLETGKLTNYTEKLDERQYDEPEGIFPDGKHTLVECDKHNYKGSHHVDIYKLTLDGSGEYERLTFYNNYEGYKSSNPVISDDGRLMAFQMARSTDPAGVGYGIFIYDFEKEEETR